MSNVGLGILSLLISISRPYTDQQGFECLCENIYHEARGEPKKGQLAVSFVTLNRVYDKKHPSDICSVVYQKGAFSWTKHKHRKKKEEVMQSIRTVAQWSYILYDYGVHFDALYYHNYRIKPYWADRLCFVCRIGHHDFYRRKDE